LTSNILDMHDTIKKAAKTVAFEWPGVMDEEDVEQALNLHLLERPNSIDKLLNEFDEKQRLNAIIKIGHQIAKQERTDYEHFSGNFRYCVDEVRQFLEDRALKNDDPELGSNWSVSDNFVDGGEFEDAVLSKSSSEIDLERGMARLRKQNAKYADIITLRYLNEIPTAELDRKQLSRALSALTNEMNRSYKQQLRDREEGPGTRRQMSRAAAYQESRKVYDGAPQLDPVANR
jgi:hypothetical protein